MHDDHTPRRFPWFRLAFGGISILVLIGSFGGFMWLLRTYVDPPRVASTPPVSAAALLAPAQNSASSEPSEPRVIMASRDNMDVPSSSRSEPPQLGLTPSERYERERYERALPPPNSGAPLPSWAGSPLPGAPPAYGVASSPSAAGSPQPSPEAGTVSLDGPVPLPRPKPRAVVRVQLPAAAPLPRPRPPA